MDLAKALTKEIATREAEGLEFDRIDIILNFRHSSAL